MGAIPLEKLKPIHLQQFYTDLLSGEREDTREGVLLSRTVLHHHRVIHMALEMAVKWQLLPHNVTDAVIPPKIIKPEIHVLDENSVREMIAAAKGTPCYTALILAVSTGMRRCEIYVLRWRDVNLEAGNIAINQSVQYSKENGLYFKEPKNIRSGRV